MFQQLVPIIAPVLVCALLGYGWSRTSVAFDREFLTRLIMNIGSPCLILRGIAGLETDPADFLAMMAVAAAILLAGLVLSALILRLAAQPLRSFVPPAIFGNTGNLGLPLCLFAFGDEGLGLAVAVYLVFSLTQFVFGPLFQGRQPAWTTLVTTPIIYAALLGLGLLVTDTQMPAWLANTVDLLGGMAIPLMLLALGHSLGGFRIAGAGRPAAIAALRLVMGFLLGLAAVELFGLTGIQRGVILIESAMPVAVFNYLLAMRYDRHPEDVAGAILISTLVAFLTMPALVLFALGDS